MNIMKDTFKFRLRIIYSLILFFVIIVVAMLFSLQIVRGDYYREKANRQYFSVTTDYFGRGDIFFNNKDGENITAATDREGFDLSINPKNIGSAEELYNKLSQVIDIDKNTFLKKIGDEKDSKDIRFYNLKITKDDIEKINNLNISGVTFSAKKWRYYPGNNLASRVLGFVGYDENSISGRYGIEKFYDSVLKKNNGAIINSFAELFSDIKSFVSNNNPETKGDVILTIDPLVQTNLEKNLDEVLNKYHAEMAGGIIMDPKTGKIVAMAIKPDFDPNNYSSYKNVSLFNNPAVENVFEFGSVMKPITIAAAIDEGKITPETTYYDKGYVELDGKKIKNFDNKSRGLSTMQDVLSYSINTGAVFAMQQLGKEEFKKYIINSGLGEKTGIDLPGEVAGKITNVINSPRDIEYATASFGQGIAVTPIEMIRALSSLANNGYLIKPYLVEKIAYDGVKDKITLPETGRQVFKKETTEQISRMLVNVFDEGLLGGIYKMDRYSIAAKTGTAQIAIEGQKGYIQGENLHSFFGYFPAFDAKFSIFLFLVRPKGVSLSSHSLSQPFVNLTKFLINYYEIPPDR